MWYIIVIHMFVPCLQSFTVVGHRYQSLADYHAVDVGELSVGEGQIVEVVKVSRLVFFVLFIRVGRRTLMEADRLPTAGTGFIHHNNKICQVS